MYFVTIEKNKKNKKGDKKTSYLNLIVGWGGGGGMDGLHDG